MPDENTIFDPALCLDDIMQGQIAEFSIVVDTAIAQAAHSGFGYLKMKSGRIIGGGSAQDVWEKIVAEQGDCSEEIADG